MNPFGTAKEALLVEAIGDFAKVLDRAESLQSALMGCCQSLAQADANLRDHLAAFEGRMAAITEIAKTRTVQHLAVRAEDATRRSIEQQSRAMADAARVAFEAEVGTAVRRLQAALQRPNDLRWDRWVAYAAAAMTGAAVAWALALTLWLR